jgi:hypothetical protein
LKKKEMAGEEGFEPSNAGIRIRCLNQLGDSPVEKTELYTKQKILQALRQKQNKAPWSALFVKEKIFFKRG